MPDRNQSIIGEIAYILNDQEAEGILRNHFKDRLILNVGDVEYVAQFAEELRLNITKAECSQVLDYIAQKSMVGITIDHVETAINELFDNRFIEP